MVLSDTLPLPDETIDAGLLNPWDDVENNLGVSLPYDYKEYIDTFGTGCIGGFIWPCNPFSSNPHLNLHRLVENELGVLLELKRKFGDQVCPYPIFPEEEGILSWGKTDNGDVLFWKTKGASEEWTVVLHEARSNNFEEYDLTMTEFIAQLVLGEINSAIIPIQAIDQNSLFSNTAVRKT